LKKEEEKKEAARKKLLEKEKLKVENAVAGKTMQELPSVPMAGLKTEPGTSTLDKEDDFLTIQGQETICTLCDARMNSQDMITSHLAGNKHNKNLRIHKSRGGGVARGGARAQGGGRSAAFVGSFGRGGRGGSHGNRGGRAPVPPVTIKQEIKIEKNDEDTKTLVDKARAEYDRVLADGEVAGLCDEEAQQKALDAMNAVLASGKDANSSRPVKIAEQGMAACLADLKVKLETGEIELEEPVEEEVDNNSWPPPHVTIVVKPKGFKPGTYKCELCDVILASEPILEAHINSPGHKEELSKPPSLRKKNQGTVYRGRTSADNIVKAQRGRRGLISIGEIMPHKMNKSERREQGDIAKSIEKHLAQQKGDVKVLPLLMNFVKGETIKPE